jgi:hypothetical protein
MLQSTLIFLFDFMFTRKIYTITGTVRTSLYQSEMDPVQVNKISDAVSSLVTDLTWIFLAGLSLTVVAYLVLEQITKKRWSETVAHTAKENCTELGVFRRTHNLDLTTLLAHLHLFHRGMSTY